MDYNALRKHVTVLPTRGEPHKFCVYAYCVGDIDFEEAHSILVDKYHYGKDGATEALKFVKKYPHLCHKPENYDKIFSMGLRSDAPESYTTGW